MAEFTLINRRIFLSKLGRGSMALVVLSACGQEVVTARTATTAGPAPTEGPATTSAAPTTSAEATTSAAPSTQAARFERVNLGFVSAYVVVRGSEAAIVDTGVSGSEGDIETALAEVGLGWDEVGHVILTHRHPDHTGSAPAVLTAAASATGYAGERDLASITAPRELVALFDGDSVFGLDVIATPGHTDGSICLLDPAASVLVAGDALTGSGDGVAGPNPEFSSNHDQALASVGKLAGFAYDQILFGHGDPVLEGGSALVAELAAGL